MFGKLTPETRLSSPFVTARLIVACALARKESRGGHYRTDFPQTSPTPVRTFIRRGAGDEIISCGAPFRTDSQ
jgi:aspartate oxidase